MAAPTGATACLPVTMPSGFLPASMPDVGNTFAADLVIDQAATVNYEGGAEPFIDDLAANCTDLRVYSDDDAIEIPFGIKQFSQTPGSRKLILGLGIPSTYPLLAAAPTPLRLYQGCNGGTFENKAGVVPVADGFAGYWALEEQNPGTAGGGAVYRDWVNDALTGLDYVSNTGKAGQIGNGQQFDGTDDYIDCGDVDVLTNAISLSAWVYLLATGGLDRAIVAKVVTFATQDPYQIYGLSVLGQDGGDREIWFGVSAGTAGSRKVLVSAQKLALNQWVRVAGVYDGTVMRIYVNGVADVNTTAATLTIGDNAISTYIGQRHAAWGVYKARWNGNLDEVAIQVAPHSADWWAADYAITSNPATAWTVGDVVPLGGGGLPVIIPAHNFRRGPSLAGMR